MQPEFATPQSDLRLIPVDQPHPCGVIVGVIYFGLRRFVLPNKRDLKWHDNVLLHPKVRAGGVSALTGDALAIRESTQDELALNDPIFTDDILETVAASARFMPHFHLPLQSGSDKILGLMRRRYRRALYAGRVARIKALMPHACIGVDVIVGFPGETDADFLDTYHFLNELPVSYLHVFPYSERPDTLAPTLPGRVQDRARHARTAQLRNLSEKKKRFFYEQHRGLETEVLFEDDVTDGRIEGFTPNYIRVAAKYDPLLVGETKPLRLTNVNAFGLMEAEEVGILA